VDEIAFEFGLAINPERSMLNGANCIAIGCSIRNKRLDTMLLKFKISHSLTTKTQTDNFPIDKTRSKN
jgi:hypothetical protein